MVAFGSIAGAVAVLLQTTSSGSHVQVGVVGFSQAMSLRIYSLELSELSVIALVNLGHTHVQLERLTLITTVTTYERIIIN